MQTEIREERSLDAQCGVCAVSLSVGIITPQLPIAVAFELTIEHGRNGMHAVVLEAQPAGEPPQRIMISPPPGFCSW